MLSGKLHEGKRIGIAVGISALVILLLAGGAGAATLTVDDSGGADYARIRDAIDNASAGDTVLVYSGTYYENVNVNKQLILKGIDTGGGKPVMDAMGAGNAIILGAGWTTLEGFRATNSSWSGGILLISNNNVVNNNDVSNNSNGIVLNYSSNNTLTGNNASNSSGGILVLYSSSNNTLSGNNASDNGAGFDLVASGNNTLSGNNVSNNGDGIYLYHSTNNTLSSNNFSNNKYYGIKFDLFGSGNTIYNNYFNNPHNVVNVWSNNNYWNIPKQAGTNIIGGPYLGGNFWANPNGTGFSQTCTDSDSNGICDSPYTLDNNNIDYLPLTVLQPANQPPVAAFTYSPLNPVVNQTITFDASPSHDPDGNMTGYWWNISGNMFTTKTVSISFPTPGNYYAGLIVTDNDGATNSTAKWINVTAPAVGGTIHGTKFNDANLNKIRDSNEEGLANWTIRLVGVDTLTRTLVNRTAITDANGNYSFTNLKPGFYTVSEILQPGWIPTTLSSRSVRLNLNENIAVDFGNRRLTPASCNTSVIHGYKFNDSNKNGTFDAGEPGLANWTIRLAGFDTCTKTPVSRVTTTNATGYFKFENITAGTYLLSEAIQPGWLPTTSVVRRVAVPANSTIIREDFGNRRI